MAGCLHKALGEDLSAATELLMVIQSDKLYELRRCYSCGTVILFVDYLGEVGFTLDNIVEIYSGSEH